MARKSSTPNSELDKDVEKPHQSSILQGSALSVVRKQAVSVRHAYKDYGSRKNPNNVFNDLNMTVQKGTIYGLLGASGCGKTTLLSCIVGRRRLNEGEIWVLGGKPGSKGSGVPGKRVGYMPQETALYGEFTIKETMIYFGWIFGMKTRDIQEKLQFLLTLLDLPPQNRIIKTLSGGQQRRVSFAVALMHDPELLILDEPTVGVDPLLRQSIWDYLVQITKDGHKTVIITTHYIEEARQAHTIGFMRNGKLLGEESPQHMMTLYKCTTLEEVFLTLSRKQEESRVGDLYFQQNKKRSGNSDENDRTGSSKGKKCICEDWGWLNITSAGKIKALLKKNFLRLWRNVGVMLFIFALPVMQVILFCLAIGREPTGLNIAIVNHEVAYMNENYQECVYHEGCVQSNYSCRYLDSLGNDTFVKHYYSTPELALAVVRKGDAWGVLYFQENFTAALFARITGQPDNETLEKSEVRVWLDMSSQQIGVILQRDLQLAYQRFAKNLLHSCGGNEAMADTPISLQDPVYGSTKPSFTDFIAPGVILTIIFFLAVALTSSALIVERTEGLLDRSWVAGVFPSEILFSHVVVQFVVMFGQTALVLIFMMLVFGVKCKGEIALLVILTILQGLCGMCFGFLISAVCNSERNATQLALGSFYPILLLSGVIWPIEGMPTVLRYISTCLPLTLATASLRAIMTRGWTIVERDVYMGFISTLIWIFVFLSFSLIVLRTKRG